VPAGPALLAANIVLLYEGGAFMWPGVKLNHTWSVTPRSGPPLTLRTLSLVPLVFEVVEDFLTPREAASIIDASLPHMAQSGVSLMDKDKGKKATEWRTSWTYFLPTKADKTMITIDERVEDITRAPLTHQVRTR